MPFGCPEFCWWLNGLLVDYPGVEMAESREKLILAKLNLALGSVDVCKRPIVGDCEAESIVNWLRSRTA